MKRKAMRAARKAKRQAMKKAEAAKAAGLAKVAEVNPEAAAMLEAKLDDAEG